MEMKEKIVPIKTRLGTGLAQGLGVDYAGASFFFISVFDFKKIEDISVWSKKIGLTDFQKLPKQSSWIGLCYVSIYTLVYITRNKLMGPEIVRRI